MSARKSDGFRARSGCFECAVCGRQTRITANHSHDNSGMCAECDEVSMLENGISDNGDPDGAGQKRINELNQQAVNKGGRVLGYAKDP